MANSALSLSTLASSSSTSALLPSHFFDWVKSIQQRMELVLAQSLPSSVSFEKDSVDKDPVERLQSAMNYAVLSGGK